MQDPALEEADPLQLDLQIVPRHLLGKIKKEHYSLIQSQIEIAPENGTSASSFCNK